MNYTPPTILQTAPPGWFFFNNSSLETLACTLRYKYAVVLGRTVTGVDKSESLTIGSCQHDILERVDNTRTEFDFHFQPNHISKWRDKVNDSLIYTTLVELGFKIYTENPAWYSDCLREYKFCIYKKAAGDLTDPIFFDETHGAIWCGTIDLLSFEDDWLVITDYKSTKKKLTGDHISSYALKSQPHFYKSALIKIAKYLPHTLPPHYIEAINKWRIKFRYVHISYTEKNYLAPTAQPINQTTYAHFETIFNDRIALARAIHDDPALAMKDGILANQCWRCLYQSICGEMDTDKEESRISRLPVKPYNPLIRDE